MQYIRMLCHSTRVPFFEELVWWSERDHGAPALLVGMMVIHSVSGGFSFFSETGIQFLFPRDVVPYEKNKNYPAVVLSRFFSSANHRE